jgi:hypothetical protein
MKLTRNRLLLLDMIEVENKEFVEIVDVANYIFYDKYGKMYENFVAKIKSRIGDYAYLFKGGSWKDDYTDKVYCLKSKDNFDISSYLSFISSGEMCSEEEWDDKILYKLEDDDPNWFENIVYNIIEDDTLTISVSKVNPKYEDINNAINKLKQLIEPSTKNMEREELFNYFKKEIELGLNEFDYIDAYDFLEYIFTEKQINDHKDELLYIAEYYIDGNENLLYEDFVNHFKNKQIEPQHTTDGSKNDYYNVFDGLTDVDSFCIEHNLDGFEFNVLKAFIGIINAKNGNGERHEGTSIQRDMNKLIHYANKMKEKMEKNNG